MLSGYSEFVNGTHIGLTEIKAMMVKPGVRNTPNVEIPYRSCNGVAICVMNPSASIEPSGGGTYPNAAINKAGLDEQSEYPIDSHKSTSFT